MNKLLQIIFKEAVANVRPEEIVRSNIQFDKVIQKIKICNNYFDSDKKFHIIGFGKAVYQMALAVTEVLQDKVISGVLSVPQISFQPIPNIKILTGAANNLPDMDSLSATEEIISLAKNVPEENIMLVLISGGGSSLLCKPVNGITLNEKLMTIKLLVASGADITELNIVRTCLSVVKGGGLGQILNSKETISLILSDVVNDPLSIIASGPTVLEKSYNQETAFDIVRKYKLELKIPKNVLLHIRGAENSDVVISQKRISNNIIGNNRIALESLQKMECIGNCKKFVLSCTVEGDVNYVAQNYFSLSHSILEFLTNRNTPVFIGFLRKWIRNNSSWSISDEIINFLLQINQDDTIILAMGGETTVRLSGNGKGGRNQELSLIFSKLCHEAKKEQPKLFEPWDVMLLCGGTDGMDGPTDAAGGIGCARVIDIGAEEGLDVDSYLNSNDSYTFLSNVANGKYLLKTGHTGTNVMDIHLLSIYNKTLP